MLNSTGLLNNLDLHQTIALAEIYHKQEFLQGKLDKFAGNIYIVGNNDLEKIENTALTLSLLVSDILILEERLVHPFRDLLETLKK